MLRRCLFVSNIEQGGGEATFHEGREGNTHQGIKDDNFQVSQRLMSMIVGADEISKVKKILGVYFTFNHSRFHKLNFESIEKSLGGLLSWRGLTPLRKIQVIKSFAIPKILYRVALISNKKEFIKKINT